MRSAAAVRAFRRVRIALYVVVGLALLYLGWRLDVTTLPEEGCSPVTSIAPGARLVVDVHPRGIAAGDRVIFRAPDGELLLGVVGPPPDSAPADVHARVAEGELWIAADDPRCPARDSRALGPIARSSVVGRVFLVL